MLFLGIRASGQLLHQDVFLLLLGITNGDVGLGLTAGGIITYQRTLTNVGALLVEEIANAADFIHIEPMVFAQKFPPILLHDNSTFQIPGTIDSQGGGLTFGPDGQGSPRAITVFFDLSNADGKFYFSAGKPARNSDGSRNYVCSPSHVLLFHELVHAAESAKTGSATANLDLFIIKEENRYRTERGLPVRDETGSDEPYPNFPAPAGLCAPPPAEEPTGTGPWRVCFVTALAKGAATTIHDLRDHLLGTSAPFRDRYPGLRAAYALYSPTIASDITRDARLRDAIVRWFVEPVELAISSASTRFAEPPGAAAIRARAPFALAALRGEDGGPETREARMVFDYLSRVTAAARAGCEIHRWLWDGREVFWQHLASGSMDVLQPWWAQAPWDWRPQDLGSIR